MEEEEVSVIKQKNKAKVLEFGELNNREQAVVRLV